MSEKLELIRELGKLSLGTLALLGLFGFVYLYRMDTKELIERQVEALEKLVAIYSGGK